MVDGGEGPNHLLLKTLALTVHLLNSAQHLGYVPLERIGNGRAQLNDGGNVGMGSDRPHQQNAAQYDCQIFPVRRLLGHCCAPFAASPVTSSGSGSISARPWGNLLASAW